MIRQYFLTIKHNSLFFLSSPVCNFSVQFLVLHLFFILLQLLPSSLTCLHHYFLPFVSFLVILLCLPFTLLEYPDRKIVRSGHKSINWTEYSK